jgi:ribosomal protein L3
MTDKKPGEQDAATEQAKKPKKTLTEIFQQNGFIDVTQPGRGIGFIGLDEYTPPESTPEG